MRLNLNKRGFSLAEMLISLLILSVVLVATMPVITHKKVTGNNAFWMSSNNSDIYYGLGNTKVGVGTNSPSSKFSVVGDTNLAGNVMVTGNTAISGNVMATGALQSTDYKASDGTSGANGSFTDKDGHIVTVKNGLITSISN